jgi:hypothetical protein
MNGPWKNEPDDAAFEAEGLPCVIRRGWSGCWCGYVSIGDDHPLFGLPTNHLLKLPASWFERRDGQQGYGPVDLLLHAMRGKPLTEACEISLAFEVHGGLNYSGHAVPGGAPDGRWWFGFDCGHAGDLMPNLDLMPGAVYRDQQYVVGECQSLAVQLVAVVKIIEAKMEAK